MIPLPAEVKEWLQKSIWLTSITCWQKYRSASIFVTWGHTRVTFTVKMYTFERSIEKLISRKLKYIFTQNYTTNTSTYWATKYKSRGEKKGAAIGKDLCDWWDYENNVEKMVPVPCFGRVSEYFFSHPSQRLYSIQLKLKVAMSENIPCHLSNYLSIKCNQRWPLRNQWIIKGKKVLESGSIVIT